MIKKILLATVCASTIATSASADYLKKGSQYVQIKGQAIAYVASRGAATNFTITNVTPAGFCGGTQYHVQSSGNYLGCTTIGTLVMQAEPFVWSTPFYFGSNPNALNASGTTLIRVE
jgi:hypothetical protein